MNWRPLLKRIPAVILVVDVLIRVTAVVTVPRNTRPSSAMAWLLAIFVAPIPGSILYAVLGSTKLPQDRRDKQRDVNALFLEVTEDIPSMGTAPRTGATPPPSWLPSVVHLNRHLGSMPLLSGNDIELLPDYRTSIQAMADAVDLAERFVHVEFYILARDTTTEVFFDALLAAHERGVDVHVLYDHWATIRNPKGAATRDWLREKGIRFE